MSEKEILLWIVNTLTLKEKKNPPKSDLNFYSVFLQTVKWIPV